MLTRSPFPGMDPWLESYWESVHHSYIQYSRDQIDAMLPAGLFAEVEETVYIIDTQEIVGRIRPDTAIFGGALEGEAERRGCSEGSVAVAIPIRIRIPDEAVVVTNIAIRSTQNGEPLITAIEVLGLTNKINAEARRKYRKKRRSYYQAMANVVEIDLLRSGKALVDIPYHKLPADIASPYRAVVRRAANAQSMPTEAEYYPIGPRERLPRIWIPLRITDEDVVLDLQQPIDSAYQHGRYATRIDYSKPLDPPLPTDDAVWAKNVIEQSISNIR